MRLKAQPEDFVVEELLRDVSASSPPSQEAVETQDLASLRSSGKAAPGEAKGSEGLGYVLYRIRKRGVTTLDVQARMAAKFRVPQSAISFAGLKDKDAVAVQYASVRGRGPAYLEGAGFSAESVGRVARPLGPGDLLGNRFEIVVRELDAEDISHLRDRLSEAVQSGVPNYFDLQRFGSYIPGEGFVGKQILRRDVEGAVRAYLSGAMTGDPPDVRAFKAFGREHWGDWALLLERAPRPSNFRSLLTFLKDHPADYKKALNLVTPSLLPLFLAAYQSHLWNRIAGGYLVSRLEAERVAFALLRLAGASLPVHGALPPPLAAELLDLSVPLPQHQARYADPVLRAAVEAVLSEEGLALNDLKARVLTRAYLPKGSRRLLVVPGRASTDDEHGDEITPGRRRLSLHFDLPPGSYATLVLKALAM